MILAFSLSYDNAFHNKEDFVFKILLIETRMKVNMWVLSISESFLFFGFLNLNHWSSARSTKEEFLIVLFWFIHKWKLELSAKCDPITDSLYNSTWLDSRGSFDQDQVRWSWFILFEFRNHFVIHIHLEKFQILLEQLLPLLSVKLRLLKFACFDLQKLVSWHIVS